MVPGNSQLVGELHVTRKDHPHLVITAGRSSFSNQEAVASAGHYVLWAARALGTARRAAVLHINKGKVPARVGVERASQKNRSPSKLRQSIHKVTRSDVVKREPEVRELATLSNALLGAFEKNEDTLRLYAQLASTGIAATSFAHELRTEFDVISESLDELTKGRLKPDQELLDLLNGSWLVSKRSRPFFR